MDSTPKPNPNPQPLSLKSKLPIKRKIPDPDPNPNLAPKFDGGGGDRSQPPYKFHRIWTEPDEIRFLQHLLDSSPNLSFPKDLNKFYSTFSQTTSHPYTKSQLSDKLRRLRKKFRVVSARLARGLHRAMLSPHDRELFDLSNRLWGPDSSDTLPLGGGGGCGGGGNSREKNGKFNLVGVEVSFSPTLDINNHTIFNRIGEDDEDQVFEDDRVIDGGSILVDNYSDAKLSEVNVELDNAVVTEQELAMPSGGGGGGGGGIGEVVAKTVMNVFDRSLEEVRTVLVSDRGSDQPVVDDLEKRWREQRVAELDVLGRRLRLVLEHSLQKQ